MSEHTSAASGAAAAPDEHAAATAATTGAAGMRGLYLHTIVVSLVGGFAVLAWFLVYEALNKLLWSNGFVTAHHWFFPVICLPFSLLVGLLVKYAHAPSNLDGSILDSLTGDVSKLEWRKLPVTVAQSLASLFSGAVLGPEGAIGNIASKIAALYCVVFRVPEHERRKLIFASVASGYNGLLENPVFTAVLGVEVAPDHAEGLAILPACLIGGGIGYAIFRLLHETGFANFLHLPPVQTFHLWYALLMVALAVAGLVLAVFTGICMRVAAALFGRLSDRVVLRALLAGVIFSIVGVFAPIVMFSGETQVHTVINKAAGYGIAVLLVMAFAKLALLERRLQERLPGRTHVPRDLRLHQRGPGAEHRLPEPARSAARGRHHDGRRVRAVPHAAHGDPAHRLHAGREHHPGGVHRAGAGHGHDRLPAAGAAHRGAAGAARGRRTPADTRIDLRVAPMRRRA